MNFDKRKLKKVTGRVLLKVSIPIFLGIGICIGLFQVCCSIPKLLKKDEEEITDFRLLYPVKDILDINRLPTIDEEKIYN